MELNQTFNLKENGENASKDDLDEILRLDGPILFQRQSENNYIHSQQETENENNFKKDNGFDHTPESLDCLDSGMAHSLEIFHSSPISPMNLCTKDSRTDALSDQHDMQFSFATQNYLTAEPDTKEEISCSINMFSTYHQTQTITNWQSMNIDSSFTFPNKEEDVIDFTINTSRSEVGSLDRFQLYSSVRSDSSGTPHKVNFPMDISLIPLSIVRLYEAVRGSFSDFSFVYAISAQMCQDLVPMDCFVNLKMGLLLSMASIEGAENKMPLPVVAIGSDSSSVSLIMNNIGNVAQRFITPLDDFQCGSTINEIFIEAGPIILAKGGVCYLGDWCRLKSSYASKILKELESGSIMVDKTSLRYPVQSAVWCHTNFYKNNKSEFGTFNTLLEIFGVPLVIEEPLNDSLADFLLEQSCVKAIDSSGDELKISLEDIKQYLSLVSRRTVDITKEASVLLRKYFIAARVDRPDCLPQRSFAVLNQMSESFAKLACRHEVLPIDVIAAIYMAESFIQNIFGPGIYPCPKLIANNYVGDVDNFFKEFGKWLQQYVERFGSEMQQ